MEPGGSERLKCIQRWKILPDYASVNLNEDDAEVNMMVLARIGVGIEAGIWTSRDAEKFIHLSSAPQCLRVLLEMTSDVPEEAEREYRRCISILRDAGVDIPILLHGEGGSVWPMVELAKKEMHDTRVGFEDGLHMADGTPARSNAQLVEYAQSLLVQ